ncbi:MAG: polyribonucleotide nucleotidyltransferase [Bacteroidales bacterium]|nr:polyribonucleotide nucleotidyltransferase [Bacteroidales bacterium]
MNIKSATISFDIDNERKITIETEKLAKQANGSVVLRMGDTMLLATAVTKEEFNEETDFLPLSVDYREKYFATGRFPGGFFKRESRPSEYEILISRLVDRALRPLFPKDYHSEIQVEISLISGESKTAPDALACLAASSALMVSDIPFNGPVSEVRVARINGKFIVNPALTDLENADIDLMVAASMDSILMVEGESQEISEDDMIAALEAAHTEIKKHCQAQLDLLQIIENKKTKIEYCHETNDEELQKVLRDFAHSKIYETVTREKNKKDRHNALKKIIESFIETIPEEERDKKKGMVKRYFGEIEKEVLRNLILTENLRVDGRKLDEIRPIWIEIDPLPSAHGSAIFTRGETQALVTVTFGTKLDEQVIDGAVIEGKNNFILHYNFPSFSTGEVKANRGTSRREIGHGNLALRALKFVMPNNEENPYTVRIVSDILESNGSSSMASVCGGTLALLDSGVKIKKPVSGIAMGLIIDTETKKFVVLSDILGDEDHLGDMDFKVCGTKDGITACQMDIKVKGISFEIIRKALEQAKAGRLHILNEMAKVITEARADYKPHVPRIEKMIIPKEFIGAVIGPGGKIIQDIQNTTKSTIVIEEVGEYGHIDIVSSDKASIEAAKNRIKAIVTVPEVGETYEGIVKNIQPFGAFIEILPNKDGLLHISEIDWSRVADVNDVLKVGDKITVKLIDIDKKTGKLKLSRKVLLKK